MEQKNNVWYKRLITGILILALCISSGIGAVQTNAAGKVKLNKTKVSLKVGKTVTLKVRGTKKKVRWTSKKKSVATVSATGKVRAKKAGTANIVAKVSGKKYTCKVTVLQKKPVPQVTEKPFIRHLEPTAVPALPPSATPVSTLKPTLTPELKPSTAPIITPEPSQKSYTFRSDSLLEEHYQKHGVDMG
nr:Ig-like domain-containing protein [Lachnospiraceae bacterium]